MIHLLRLTVSALLLFVGQIGVGCLTEGWIGIQVVAQTPVADSGELQGRAAGQAAGQAVESEPQREIGEPGAEDLDEWELQIQATRRERALAEERLEILDVKIDWLTRRRRLDIQIEKLEEQVDQGDPADEHEELAEELRLAELEAEKLDERVELLGGRLEINGLRVELSEFAEAPQDRETLRRLRGSAKTLDQILQARLKLAERWFRLEREEAEEELDALEEERENLGERFELGLEAVHLEMEIRWARRRGDDEAVEEMEAELKAIRRARQRSESPQKVSFEPMPDWANAVTINDAEIQSAGALGIEGAITPVLKQHCFDCHAGDSAEADLDLAAMLERRPLVADRDAWRNVRQQVAVGSMPPPDSERVPISQRRQLVAGIEHAIEQFDYASVQTVGYEPARRLTHREYDNAVSDLFGVSLHPTERFPVDMTSKSGFDNNAAALTLGPLMLERYASAAEAVVASLLPEHPVTQQQQHVRRQLLRGGTERDAMIRFAARAFRRALDAEEQASLEGRFDRWVERTGDASFAFRTMVQAVLMSPSFLIRNEIATDNSEVNETALSDETQRRRGRQVSGEEMATRLSFFLWSSIPDESLAREASAGRLFDPGVLHRQVDRMLDDPRSLALGEDFAVQWLGLSNLHRVQRDQIENPWATDSLVQAMRDETALFFHSLVREDASVDRLVDADYTFLNAELAAHYGIDVELTEKMQRVSVDASRRGGVLAQGGVLAVTSFPHRTSPVVRGNWILGTLLGTPPPPPPPNVSEFEADLIENRRLSSRERLQLHRNHPNCYGCHSQIDPLGFALEQFDWFGRWRGGRETDVRGQLPSGQSFEGLSGLKQTLVKNRGDDLVRQITQMMMEYALGRSLDYRDEATVRETTAAVNGQDRRVRSLIHAIVSGDTFQRRMPGPGEESKR